MCAKKKQEPKKKYRNRKKSVLYLEEGGEDGEEAVGGEDVVEVSGGVDVYAEAGAYHVEVVWVKNKGAVDDVEKGSEVPGGGGLGVHAGEERPDKLAPGVLVEHVGG